MTHTVHFADRTLRFASDLPASGTWFVYRPSSEEELHRAKIVKILESHKCVALLCDDPDAAFECFARGFARVTAGGGVAVDDRGRRLMMRRNGRWDLPKGHLEPGETIEECAAREVEEETGIAVRVVAPLCETLHAYWFPPTGRWELKRTCWFLLSPAGGRLRPQREEGVECLEWSSPAQAAARAAESFPTIRRVMEALEEFSAARNEPRTASPQTPQP